MPPELSIAETLRTDRPLSGRQWRLLAQQILVFTAVGCFLASLPLPAIAPDMGSWNRGGPYPGWFCALIAWQFYPLNAVILLSPFWTWYLRGRLGPVPQLTVAALLSAPLALPFFGDGSNQHHVLYVGCYLWVTSYVLVAAAAWIPVWRCPSRITTGRPADAG